MKLIKNILKWITAVVLLMLLAGTVMASFGYETSPERVAAIKEAENARAIELAKARQEDRARQAAQLKADREAEEAKAKDSANAYSVLVAASNIAPRLNDPESLEIIEAVREVNTGTICILYSAKNGFGGRVREGFAVVDGRVSDYSAVCQSGGSYKDYTNYVKWNI